MAQRNDAMYRDGDSNKIEYKVLGWRRDGAVIEVPEGIHAEDFFVSGQYAGPDGDGVEPVLHIRYEDGVHMTQKFTNEHKEGWFLIGYDGILRDIPDTGEVADAFRQIVA